MNYSKAYIRFLPFLLLPLVFIFIDNYSGRKADYTIYIIIFSVLLVTFLFLFFKSYQQKNILQNGIKGTAKLISVEDTGVQINYKPQLILKLLVSIPGKNPYEVTHTDSVDYFNMKQLQPGAELSVMVTSKNPNKLLINWNN